jgi:hypothetical protein
MFKSFLKRWKVEKTRLHNKLFVVQMCDIKQRWSLQAAAPSQEFMLNVKVMIIHTAFTMPKNYILFYN